MQSLYSKIMHADSQRSRANGIHDAIIKLSTNETVADILAWELRNAAIDCENVWCEIEQRDDFKAKYGTDRQKALEDFLNGNLTKNG